MTGGVPHVRAVSAEEIDSATPHGISVDLSDKEAERRPAVVTHLSSPPNYHSPIRHHRRNHSTPRQVKETLDARSEYTNSEDDGQAQHRINQYIVKQEIGRGSFGAVHLAVDQYGNEFAVKEFSKSRLRKRAQSHILRRPPGANDEPHSGHLAAGVGFNSPLHRRSASDIHSKKESGNPLYLIQEEIAIMKKLNHDNLVSLVEVLDDPEEDSLYMVLEMCKKGVIMKVGLGERAEPYDSEKCRHWFRDLILGIEYLHAQGIVHRDIKPDNLLLTEDDVLKIVDFGVSEMFEKQSDMLTAKSAGSPAFLPPELCVAKHGGISGRAADIWSMGISLYCLRFGKIPFERFGVLDLYEAIKKDQLTFESAVEPDFVDLMHKLLEKDPAKRIAMPEIREHPWITRNGTDPLLSTEENTADLIEPPTQAEMESAITGNFRQLLTVMKAVKRFKDIASRKRPRLMEGMFGRHEPVVQPPHAITPPATSDVRSHSLNTDDRKVIEGALDAKGIHREIDVGDLRQNLPPRGDRTSAAVDEKGSEEREEESPAAAPHSVTARSSSGADVPTGRSHQRDFAQPHGHEPPASDKDKRHAHDPTSDEPVLLDIGPGNPTEEEELHPSHIVSESPPAADINIYETAYRNEVERIRESQGSSTKVYLTKRVDKLEGKLEDKGLLVDDGSSDRPKIGWAKVLEKTKTKVTGGDRESHSGEADGEAASEKKAGAN